MGLTKQYLRFVPCSPEKKLNIICNANCNIVTVKLKDNEKFGRYITCGAAEDAIIWDCRSGKKIRVINGEKHECVCLGSHWQSDQLAIGYRDGTVNLYSVNRNELISTFSGHSSSITTISFDEDGHRLATGSLDTEVVIWDVVAEQGLFRLSGHKGSITRTQFMKTRDIIVTSSKDTFVKFWDLKNGHCFKTLTGHVTEVWSFCLMKNDSYLVTGTNDSELRVWRITDNDAKRNLSVSPNDEIEYYSPIECTKSGSVLRQGLGRIVGLWADDSAQILACHGNEKLLEIFHFIPEEEVLRKYNKKQKKLKKKMNEKLHDGEVEHSEQDLSLPSAKSLMFCVTRLAVIKTLNKIKSTVISFENAVQKVKTIIATNSNTLEVHSFDISCKESNLEKVITGPGHDSDVRCVTFDNEDNTSIVSGSGTGLKLWNRGNASCLRTIVTEYILSVCFVSGGRYVLAGLKNGALVIVDVASADVVEIIEAAHSKEVWRVAILPSKQGCVSCGGDCTIKIWNLEWLASGVLTLLHARTLKLDEPVLDVQISPDGNLIAAALLDCTVKIFFSESFKFFLNLYGHKLPVTCLDVSYDSTIVASGSADRHVKIWGLDYGDCHKSIFAHEDTVTSLRFVPNTHYFFTCGKDGSVKQWDGDNYQRILTLSGHLGEAWCLSVSGDGQYLVSCGQDRVIRVYEKSFEPLVLEDERETERQQQEEETLATGADSVLHGRSAIHLASRKTVSAEKGAELLMECLQVLREFEQTPSSSCSEPAPTLPPIMVAFNVRNGNEYLIAVLRKIRTSDLEEILSLLPFASACQLLERMLPVLRSSQLETELLCRVIVFLLRVHHRPVISSRNLFLVLQKLATEAHSTLSLLKDTVGCNLHALFHLQREKELRENVRMFENVFVETQKSQMKKRKKQLVASTAVLKLC